MAPPITGDLAPSTSVTGWRKDSGPSWESWEIISPIISEENRPRAMAPMASTKYRLKIRPTRESRLTAFSLGIIRPLFLIFGSAPAWSGRSPPHSAKGRASPAPADLIISQASIFSTEEGHSFDNLCVITIFISAFLWYACIRLRPRPFGGRAGYPNRLQRKERP